MQRKFTLKKRRASRKDYSHARTHSLVGSPPLPQRLLFLTRILNQFSEPKCSACTSTEIRESMKPGVLYDPDKQWTAIKLLYGDPNAQGVDIETAMATGVKTGFFRVATDQASDKASAYFWVTPTKSFFNQNGLDTFDAIRQAINFRQAPLSGGLTWYAGWDGLPNGVVNGFYGPALGGHDVKIAGFDTINGIESIVIQNSHGQNAGDNGLFYFNREMTNKCFVGYGIAYWSDDQNPDIKRLGLFSALLSNLINLLNRLQQLTNK